MRNKYEINKALKIGSVCIFTYMLSYYMRNILSVITPQLLEEKLFSKEFIASLSSTYFILYAIGQFINGIIGDIIKPKIMISAGLLVASVSLTAFPVASGTVAPLLCFAFLGLGFSMLRGPLVKLVSENAHPKYARLFCMLLSVFSYFGPLIASVLSLLFSWRYVFVISGIISATAGVLSFLAFSHFEADGLVIPIKNERSKNAIFDFLEVFKLDNFSQALSMTIILQIVSTSVSFWIPTYISEVLHFTPEESGIVFSFITCMRSVAPFMSGFLFHIFGNDYIKPIRVTLCLTCVNFAVLCISANAWANLICVLIAMVSSSCAAEVLWSIYIPSLGKSGRVSTANGIMDSTGYGVAAIFNVIFAKIMTGAGWNGVIITWVAIVAVGILITMFIKKPKQEI